MITRSVDEAYTPVKVAIVDNEDSVLSRILIRAIGQTEQISALLQTERMREDEAAEAFERGECAAIIDLPEGFIDNIFGLRSESGTILLSDEMASQVAVVSAVAGFGERILAAGQYAIYCGEEILAGFDAEWDTYDMMYKTVNPALLLEAFSANREYIQKETMDYASTGMDSDAYFALCWIAALMFFCSLFFVPLITSDCTHALLARFATLGIGNVAFIRWKVILLWIFRAVLLIIVALIIPQGFVSWNALSVIGMLCATLYIAILGVCLTLCFGNGITANIIFSVSGLFLCGGIVPRQMLPAIVTKIGDFTPFGVAMEFLKPAFDTAPDILSLALAFVYAAAAVAIIIFHLERTRAGKGDVQI